MFLRSVAPPLRSEFARTLAILFCLVLSPWASAAPEPRVTFPGSIAPEFQGSAVQAVDAIDFLSAPEAGAETSFAFELELKLRNHDELLERVARGEVISRAEMLERYYPTTATHEQAAAWLRAQGAEVEPIDSIHLSVQARAPLRRVSEVLAVRFAQMTTGNGSEHIVAISPPSLPESIAEQVIAIGGLQPHVRLRPQGALVSIDGGNYLAPDFVRQHYGAGNYDGEGQVIAIMGGIVDLADLQLFWARNRVPQSLDNITKVNPGWRQPTDYGLIEAMEVTADVQWASAIAPAAKIRIYETVDVRRFATAILNDRPTVPGLSQASMSFGLEESAIATGIVQAESQYLTALAAEGINVFVASGDSGSTHGDSALSANNYDPDGDLAPYYPASAPTVIAVGGTYLGFDPDGVAVTSESAFGSPLIDGVLQKGGSASGGGHSLFFPRPSWQVGEGVPTGTTRVVPDVSAIWGSSLAEAHFYYQGQSLGWGGTSLSAPVWGALCALLNQARDQDDLPAIGMMGPLIYPLIGTDAFRDVTTGTNGAYFATVGFDLCTGVGVPDIESLHLALASAALPPVPALPQVVQAPTSVVVAPGSTASFTVGATGTGGLSYQWLVLPTEYHSFGDFDQAPWEVLTDSTTYSGTTTPTLQISSATAELHGQAFQCRIFNDHGIALTDPVVLSVDATGAPIAPIVTRQPEVIYAFPGQSAHFSVRVAGTGPFDYRWSNPATFAVPPGGIGNTLSFDSAKPGDTAQYLVNISGPGGSTLSSAWLLVMANPTLTVPSAVGGVVDAPFSYRIVATNYDLAPSVNEFNTTFSARGLPPGLVLNQGTGVIFGYPTEVGTFAVEITATNALGSDTAQMDFVITAAGTPVIIGGPTIGSTSNPNFPFIWQTLHVAATGGNLTYRWFREGQPLSDGSDYMGSDTATLMIAGNATNPAGAYSVVVTNDFGEATSSNITLTGNGKPLFGTQPPRHQYVAEGEPVLLSAGASSWNGERTLRVTSYQWRHNGVDIPGATSSSLQFEAITSSDAGTYTVVATNSNGSTTSNPAVISIVAPPVITQQPTAVSAVAGEAVSLELNVADATALTFQWFKNDIVIPGADTTTLSFNPAAETDAGHYHVVIRGPHGAISSSSAQVSVTAAAAPMWTLQPRDVSGVPGGSVTFTAHATAAPAPTYQWQHDHVDIPGATSPTLTLSGLSSTHEGTYTLVATNRIGSITSQPATLNLFPAGLIASHTLQETQRTDTTATATILGNVTSPGPINRLDWDVLLPEGWNLVSSSGASGATASPESGAGDLLSWTWTPAGSIELSFAYTIEKSVAALNPNVADELVTLLTVETADGSTEYLVSPDPLTLRFHHSADFDGDDHLSLSELLRVIELYNTRAGTTRTGRYRVESGTDDGFNPEIDNDAPLPGRFHSADVNRDGQLSLSELLRVIELYNTRTGTTRTGRYRFSPDTEDGFNPDP